ncbi:MAG: 3'-5' exonuclease domain-containing protein 2 [Bacteriovoracaceae bacterium]|nr:3'-5' exonuclease domain-containing protein 2 [Bacteriovoracaceae bacterium]
MTKYANPVLKPQMSKEVLQTLSLFNHPGRYELIETVSAALKAIEELQKASILGFDTETRPSFRKGEFYKVALLQLATHECCYLFRLNKIPLQPELVSLLEDENIKKVGVAIRDDLIALQKRASFNPGGFIDLAEKTRISKSESLSLRALCGMYLNQRLSKAAKVTNWESPVLTAAQAKYAANDAFVSLLIFEKMFVG